jgi:hypothetical protein
MNVDGYWRLRIVVANETRCGPAVSRDDALRVSLIGTHAVMATCGSFVSLLDPPPSASAAVASCRNVNAFPVLAGRNGDRSLLLSSPIVLYDNPQIAPESHGDFFDATEIDELLTLRTITLTDEEKREARRTDPRAADLVDRVESLPPEMMSKLHGAVRSLRPVEQSRFVHPTEGAEHAVIGGVTVGRGSRVVLRPDTRRADAQDVFLRDRVGVVESVLTDVDGTINLAVTIEDDPAADINRWFGRFYHFATHEVVPVGERE